MTIQYKLMPAGVLNLVTGAVIPRSEGNRQWQEYLEWERQGNQPLPYHTLQDKKELKITEIKRQRSSEVNQLTSQEGLCFDLAYAIYLVDKQVRGVLTTKEQVMLTSLRERFDQVTVLKQKEQELLSRVESAIDDEDLTRIQWEQV